MYSMVLLPALHYISMCLYCACVFDCICFGVCVCDMTMYVLEHAEEKDVMETHQNQLTLGYPLGKGILRKKFHLFNKRL